MNRAFFGRIILTILVVVSVLVALAWGLVQLTTPSSKTSKAPAAANATPESTAPLPDASTTGSTDTYTNHVTAFDDDGGGNVRFFDRQNVDCFVDGQVNGGLNSFVLTQQAPDSGKVQYTYKCSSTSDSMTKDKCRNVSTAKDDDGAGSPEYLDRQVVACNNGEEISQFKLSQPDGPDKGKIRYDYTCCPTSKTTCRDVTTTTTPFGWGPLGMVPQGGKGNGVAKASARFLDKQNVQCNNGEVLRSFKLVQPNGPSSNTVAYKYTCCS